MFIVYPSPTYLPLTTSVQRFSGSVQFKPQFSVSKQSTKLEPNRPQTIPEPNQQFRSSSQFEPVCIWTMTSLDSSMTCLTTYYFRMASLLYHTILLSSAWSDPILWFARSVHFLYFLYTIVWFLIVCWFLIHFSLKKMHSRCCHKVGLESYLFLFNE